MWDPPLPPPSQRPARILKPNKPPLRRRLYDLMKKHRPTCPRHTHTHALVLPSPVRDCFARSHAWLRSGPGLLGFCLGGSPVSAEDQRHQGPAWGERIRAPFQRVPFPMGKKKSSPFRWGRGTSGDVVDGERGLKLPQKGQKLPRANDSEAAEALVELACLGDRRKTGQGLGVWFIGLKEGALLSLSGQWLSICLSFILFHF